MCCTLTGVVLRGRRLHVFHVGDTRLYRLRDEKLTRLTRDHRPDGNAVTNMLTRAIGAEETVKIDYQVDELHPYDRLLLCCDGVHEPLSDRKLEELLIQPAAPEETARRLVAEALEAGGKDNTTALVIDILALPAIDLEHLGQATAALPLRGPPTVGDVIDGFELQTLLADGRYSRVFKATDTTDGGAVLLKFPKAQAMGAEAGARGAFLREAWVSSRVQNPFVGAVLALAAGRQTSLYLAQPYYEGETLEARLTRKPPVSLDVGLDIAVKLAKAAASLHRAGVIHRDIKPDNVILQPEAGVKLIDLGVARLPHLEGVPGPDTPGTPSYMAPELFTGAAGDERSDIFALGVTLFRMFGAGAYPYGEVEPFQTPRFKKPTPLSQHRPDLPAWLEQVIAKAVAVDPDERYQDGFELAFELENGALRGHAGAARPTNLYDRDPVRFWQVLAVLLFAALLVALATR